MRPPFHAPFPDPDFLRDEQDEHRTRSTRIIEVQSRQRCFFLRLDRHAGHFKCLLLGMNLSPHSLQSLLLLAISLSQCRMNRVQVASYVILGAAGNRTRVREISERSSFTCVVGLPYRQGWLASPNLESTSKSRAGDERLSLNVPCTSPCNGSGRSTRTPRPTRGSRYGEQCVVVRS